MKRNNLDKWLDENTGLFGKVELPEETKDEAFEKQLDNLPWATTKKEDDNGKDS